MFLCFLSSPEHQRKGILAWFDITHQLIREHVFCILHQRKTDWQQVINRMFVKEENQKSDKITKRWSLLLCIKTTNKSNKLLCGFISQTLNC